MKLTLITVCYNSEKTIQNTIDSVVAQTYKNNVEFIVVDGNSNDGTKKILYNNFDHIDLALIERDDGLYDAMNKAINMASGDIIGILNSDDLFFSRNTLENIVNCFIKYPNIDFLYGDLVYVDQLDTNKIIRKWKSKKITNFYFNFGNVPAHPTIYIKCECYKKLPLYDLTFKFASDYDFILRLFLKNNFNYHYLEQYLVKMRLGGLTSSGFYNRMLQNREIYRSWKKNSLKIPFYFFPAKVILRILQYF